MVKNERDKESEVNSMKDKYCRTCGDKLKVNSTQRNLMETNFNYIPEKAIYKCSNCERRARF